MTRPLRARRDWNEFAVPGAPEMNFVFTVCDNAAEESCPVWPGQPMTAHWGVPDPAAVEGTEAEKHLAFADATQPEPRTGHITYCFGKGEMLFGLGAFDRGRIRHAPMRGHRLARPDRAGLRLRRCRRR